MKARMTDTDTDAGEPAALAAWVELSDALMRGLVHALNNRITALSALAELAALGDDVLTAQRVLPSELARLHEVNMMFRLLLTEEMPPEAMELVPVLDDALALHAHHSRLRSVRCEVVHRGTILPVRAPRWALLRLLLLLLEYAREHADGEGTDGQPGVAVLQIAGGEASIDLTVSVRSESGHYARAMAELCGGRLEVGADRITACLPTLLEVRRAERAAREAVRAP
jgi:hypothetical protein